MRTVTEVSWLTGVSVRTLHHYDAIGLLKPTEVTEAGYRLYDDEALRRLQSILLFRELQFPLREIKAILDDPGYDPAEALAQQIKLLELQKRRMEDLIRLAREIQKRGDGYMEFHVFDKSELEQYKAEAKQRWGNTQAYQEYERKAPDRSGDELMALFAEIGTLRHLPPDSREARKAVMGLQRFITEHYYTCTPEILAGLGQMYVGDERFRQNIDRAGGDGTAEFVRQAIAAYCAGK